ncbi:hypothetical protein CEXT_331841 [Caerostris extrusa]|uniref:Uncharacterized protein n=1 Tax=Caerostris extrusa TaxID=172846 RepID=A0AAV4M6L8_CAEEX|nr:hypothetical protein CEXT_331841 [Caerostris extrusa]
MWDLMSYDHHYYIQIKFQLNGGLGRMRDRTQKEKRRIWREKERKNAKQSSSSAWREEECMSSKSVIPVIKLREEEAEEESGRGE